jgi:hypothetical protein
LKNSYLLNILGRMNANGISLKANPRLKRIQFVSGIFRSIFFAIALLCGFAGMIALPLLFLHNSSKAGLIASSIAQWTAAILSWYCYKLFALYSHGDLFTGKIVSAIRRVGYAYFIVTVVGCICETIAFHSFKAISPPPATDSGPGWVSTFFVAAGGILPAFLIIFIAWVMDEGRKIQEEQELTV